MNDLDIIVGIHSIKHALIHRSYTECELYISEEATNLFSSKEIEKAEVFKMNAHELQLEAAKFYKQNDLVFKRIPGQAFLVISQKEVRDVRWLYDQAIKRSEIKLLALDGITDIHNAGAIFRTACFYGVDIILTPSKNSFRLTPSFYRIASGSVEHIEVVQVGSMAKTLNKVSQLDIRLIALSEHSDQELSDSISEKICLILGKEDTGVSNAVMRTCSDVVSLKSKGVIKSLNVSVASALAMEKVFGN